MYLCLKMYNCFCRESFSIVLTNRKCTNEIASKILLINNLTIIFFVFYCYLSLIHGVTQKKMLNPFYVNYEGSTV